MSHDRKIVDLIGEQELKASESVQVRQITNLLTDDHYTDRERLGKFKTFISVLTDMPTTYHTICFCLFVCFDLLMIKLLYNSRVNKVFTYSLTW